MEDSLKKLNLNKKQIFILIIVSLLVSVYIFFPHFPNEQNTHPLPLHMDEWHHISQAINLEEGEYDLNSLTGLQVGFHFFLSILNKLFDLVLIYKFLPAIWAFITCVIFFFLVYSSTKQNFFISIVATSLLGSIGFNNLFLGMSFFTPLTFAIPFIFLYLFLFIQGVQNKNKRKLIFSFIIMLFLLILHAISVLFSFPILILTGILHKEYIKKEFKFFLLFLIVPIAGVLFYWNITKITLLDFQNILELFIFSNNWANVEIKKIYFGVLYTPIGFLFSIIGFFTILLKREKEYFPYLFWPLYLLISLLTFNLLGISFFAPAQRNYYYLILGLPLITSFGIYFTYQSFGSFLEKLDLSFFKFKNNQKKLIKRIKKFLAILLVILIIFSIYYLSFSQIRGYHLGRVNMEDYESLKFLSNYPSGNVLSPIRSISLGVKPISGHNPIAVLYFTHPEREEEINLFFSTEDCELKNLIIKKYYVNYIVSNEKIDCQGYELIYSKKPYIYNVFLID